jgi:O-acetyl-ADP-ribose deacetylase (regulator of RNase III)
MTSIYSYPLQAATEIAVRTVREFVAEAGSLETVHFACFSDEVLRAYTGLGVVQATS